jgi:hypothetical protein
LCTYPVEHMAALTPGVNPDGTVTLYDALARHAGVRRLGGAETAEGVELGPFGITVLAVTGSAAQAKPRPM